MRNRRDFCTQVAGAVAGAFLANGSFATARGATLQGTPAGRRREVSIGGRRIKVVDVHAHHFVPEVLDVVRGTPLEAAFKGQAANKDRYLGPHWLEYMNKEGIDVMALNMNPWWYAADRDLARKIITLQNRKAAEWCARYPDRFVGMATAALQHPDLAAEQLEEGVNKYGMRGAPIGAFSRKRPAAPRRGSRHRENGLRHGLSVRLASGRRLHPERVVPQRCRQRSNPRREPGESPSDHVLTSSPPQPPAAPVGPTKHTKHTTSLNSHVFQAMKSRSKQDRVHA